LKPCTNCRGNLADFVTICPYCGVAQPVVQTAMAQPEWGVAPQNSNKALASLICGVLFLFVPASIAAVILGHFALVDIKRSAGRLAGHGMAVAGLVMGYLGIAITAMFTIAIVFAVRTTLRHNVPANEFAAIQTMRTYNQALKAYAAKCPQQGYPATLVRLGPGNGDCSHANLLDARLAIARPVKLGYQFVYSPGVSGAERVAVFALVASPVQPGLTGKQYFFLDESGVIRRAPSQIIGPRSDPVDNPDNGEEKDKDEEE
jgi:hypothetical protein